MDDVAQQIAALKARIDELEANQPATRKPYSKTATSELPIDSSAASRASGAYAEYGQEALRAVADAEQTAHAERVRQSIEHSQRARGGLPTERDAADRALAADWAKLKELPVGAADDDESGEQ
jgi:hypothetical protein